MPDQWEVQSESALPSGEWEVQSEAPISPSGLRFPVGLSQRFFASPTPEPIVRMGPFGPQFSQQFLNNVGTFGSKLVSGAGDFVKGMIPQPPASSSPLDIASSIAGATSNALGGMPNILTEADRLKGITESKNLPDVVNAIAGGLIPAPIKDISQKIGASIDKPFLEGQIPEAMGEGAASAAAFAALRKAGMRQGASPEALASKGIENIKSALATPPGVAGQRAMQMASDLSVAQKHLANIAKESPLDVGIVQKLGGKGDPEWFSKTAGDIADYRENLWEKAHKVPVDRHANEPFDSSKVFDRAVNEISGQDDLAQTRLAEQWIEREIPRIKTVADADARIRRLNAEITKLPEEYGPIGVRVRLEALRALRDGLDEHLESVGETGVKQANREWGALGNIEGRLRERYFQETGKAAKAAPIPDWAHLYAFAHPGGISFGTGLRVGRMLMPSPASKLASGMAQLRRSNLASGQKGTK